MNTKAVMITTKENAPFLIEELGDVIEKEDVFIKLVTEEDFSLMTSKKETVDVDIPDEEFLELAKIAHEEDITFNNLVNNILREKMEKEFSINEKN